MSDTTDLAVVEQPQQLITIEPAEYVAQVFEPFAKRLADAKQLALSTTYDVKTTAGMATAVKIRATFRDIRVESEKARKVRKAPILEIGKLLDSRQKEIEAEIEPLELAPDLAIKAEEARKEAERQAKLAAEQQRIAAIRARIDGFRNRPAEMIGMPSDEIGEIADVLSETVIDLATYMEFADEAQVERDHVVKKLREMQAAQAAVEQEQARLAEERAQLERDRAAVAEHARKEAAARAEREEAEREQRRIAEEEQRLIQERAAAAMREQQEAHERRMAEQRAELQRQQDEINAAREEQERIAREAREAAEAAARIEADHADGLEENARIDAERAAAFEAQQQEAQRRADEAERIRRELNQFLINGPGDSEIVEVLVAHYDVGHTFVVDWLAKFDAASFLTPFSGEKAA